MGSKLFIIGAGIVGQALARQASISLPNTEIHVIDVGGDNETKPSLVNSGVIHSGIYYRTNSLRAKFCLQGNTMLKNLANELGVPEQKTGKLIVAHLDESAEFERLAAQANANGVQAEKISTEEARELQTGIPDNSLVLRVKSTSVINPVHLMNEREMQLISAGVIFHQGLVENGSVEEIQSLTGQAFDSRAYLVNAAGSGSLAFAHQNGRCLEYALVPVRGRYLQGIDDFVRLNLPIYGLPKKDNFALGNHLTPRQAGGFSLGPSAEIDLDDLYKANGAEWVNEFLATTKTGRLFSELQVDSIDNLRDQMIKEATQLFEPLANLNLQAFSWGKMASRPQLVRKIDGKIQDDFMFLSHERTLHILNVVSPGWTSSPAIAKYVVDGLADKF